MPYFACVLNLLSTLSKLNPILLHQVDGAELMSRLDQKFLIRSSWIPDLLLECQEDYKILEVEGERITTYLNQFIENDAMDALEEHIRGRKIRSKARIRKYESNKKRFIEIKQKTVKGKTIKYRLERAMDAAWNAPLNEVEQTFLSDHFAYAGARLTELQCEYDRLTLVSNEREERITIDTRIQFHLGKVTDGLGNLAIMEVKQLKIDRFSPMLVALKKFRFSTPPLGRQIRLSKFVVGTLLLNPNLPARTYRATLMQIDKLRNDTTVE